jgi:hypothetical protein
MKKLLLALALTVAAAACGGDDGDTASGPAGGDEATEATETTSGEDTGDAAGGGGTQLAEGDPCGLLTDEEILEAISETVFVEVESREGVPFEPSGGQCNITVAHPEGSTGFSVAVGPADMLDVLADGDREPIEGIGDEAFEASDNYYAVVGDVYVHIVNVPGSNQREDSIALLKAAAGRV